MTTTSELLRQGRMEEVWKKYCGFIDLNLHEFMEIQRRLLKEQIDLLAKCEIGRGFLGEPVPRTLEEFRAQVPLTTYSDYAAFAEKREDEGLPVKPRWWLRTSGRSGEYGGYKWVPYTARMAKRLGESVMCLFIMASCGERGYISFAEGDRMLFTMAPFPYMSGGVARAVLEEFPFQFLPPLEQAESMDYPERIAEGLRLALIGGVDHINAIAVVLVRIAEQFSEGASNGGSRAMMRDPRIMLRGLRGMIRARLAGRKHLLPKDLWTVKGVATGGTDTTIFREQMQELWGHEPIETYGCTEAGLFACQLWNGKGMTLVPDVDLLEFMPFDEHLKCRSDPDYVPRTLLADELEVGVVYEPVVTNYLGGIYTRYRVGDLVRVISMRDDELGVELPQIVFHSKAGDMIDIASFARLTELTLWQALENTGLKYADWTARKEQAEGKPVLALYVEPKSDDLDESTVKERFHQALMQLDQPYADLEEMLGIDPLRVKVLERGAFGRYYQQKVVQGADLAHLKPPHMNSGDDELELLMRPS